MFCSFPFGRRGNAAIQYLWKWENHFRIIIYKSKLQSLQFLPDLLGSDRPSKIRHGQRCTMKRANCEKRHSCPRQCPFPVLSHTSGDKCPWSSGFAGCCVTRGSRSAPTRLCQGPANIKWWGIKTKILWKRKIFFRFFQFFGSFGPRHVNSMTNCSLHLRFFNGGSVFSVYNNIVNSN